MPRTEGPLQSLIASGTIGKQITFRRTNAGIVVTRKPRHPHPIPNALRVNTVLVRYLHSFAKWAFPYYKNYWQARADKAKTTAMNEFIRCNLERWRTWRGFRCTTNDDEFEYAPDPPLLQVTVPEDSTTPTISTLEDTGYDYLSLHRVQSADDPGTPDNVIGFLDHYGGPTTFDDAYNLHGTIYWRAVAWFLCATGTTCDPALQATLP